MEEGFKKKKIDKLFWALSLGSLFLSGAAFALIRIFLPPGDRMVILHYNSYLGIGAVSFNFREEYFQIFLAPLAALAVTVTGFVLALLLLGGLKKGAEKEQEKQTAAYLLLGAGLTGQMVLLVYVAALIWVNF